MVGPCERGGGGLGSPEMKRKEKTDRMKEKNDNTMCRTNTGHR